MADEPKEDSTKALSTALTKAMPTIRQVLPPSSSLIPEKIVRMALMEVAGSDSLKRCEPFSIARAVVQAAALGLHVGTLMGEAYLVPYKGKCSLIPGYKGLIKLAVQGLSLVSPEARLVYKDDVFDVDYGTAPRIIHKPAFGGPRGDKEILYAYFIGTLRDGTKHFEVMTREEVEKRRNNSKAKDDGPWVTWYPEQFKKTVVRYGVKLIPASSDADALERLNAAIELDNRYDEGRVLNTNPLLDDNESVARNMLDRTRERTGDLRAQLGVGTKAAELIDIGEMQGEPVAQRSQEEIDAEIAEQDAETARLDNESRGKK